MSRNRNGFEISQLKTLSSIFGLDGEESFTPLYGRKTERGDGFAYLQVISMPISPDFAVDEESIRFGVKFFASMIAERTINKN